MSATSFRSRFRLHRAVVALIVVGLAATLACAEGSRRLVASNDRELLIRDTGQASMIATSMLGQVQSLLNGLGNAVLSSHGNAQAFEKMASRAQKLGGFTALSLVRTSGKTVVPVASAGAPLHGTALDPEDGPRLAGLIAAGESGIVGFRGSGVDRRMLWLVAPPATPAGFGVIMESRTPEGADQGQGFELPFKGINFAVYVGSKSDQASLVFTNTTHLPFRGKRAVSVTASSSDQGLPPVLFTSNPSSLKPSGTQLQIQMQPAGHPYGSLPGLLPAIFLVAGLFGVGIVGMLLELALRRRDRALELVDELEDRNLDLDRAIASRDRTAAELRQAQKMEAVGQLAGGIAHDFNNLLAVMLTYTGFIAEGIPGEHPLQDDVREVRKAAQRAADLTRQLLVFSRRDVTRPEVVDLNEVVHGTSTLLGRTLGENIEIELELTGEACPVVSDRRELEQVLMNLAVNARDAMPDGGTLTVRTAIGDHTEVGLPAGLLPGRYVTMSVHDSGVGMSQAVLNHVFEPFFTTKDVGKGTGLGLAMVYGIVTGWGGEARATSEPGHGTTIEIFLPASLTPAVAGEVSEPAVAEPTYGERLLLVEDEESVRRATARILRSAGYSVVEASSGPEALRLFDGERFHGVVTDVVMRGGISGPELADRLTTQQPDLCVLFVSGYGAEAMTHRDVDRTRLLPKPFTRESLLAAVRRTLDHSPEAVA